LSKQGIAASDLTIHAVSISLAGGGTAGVGAAVGVVVLTSNAYAYSRGAVTKAESVTVKAISDYKNIIGATLAVGAGAVGVSASAGIVVFNGTTYAAIEKTAGLNQVGKVTVSGEAYNTASAAASAISGGGVAVNGAVAVVVNKSRTETFIAQGANIDATGAVSVNADVNTNADTYLLGAAIGGVAVGVCAAVSVLKPVVYTYIGSTPKGTVSAASNGGSSVINASSVTVSNNVVSKTVSKVLSVAGGAVAVNGNVLLNFNYTDALAETRGVSINAENVTINADFDTSAKAELLAATAGAVSIGATVTYVTLEAVNAAVLDTGGITINAESVHVYAKDNKAKAEAYGVSGNIGAIAVNLNAAVADNHVTNMAVIMGNGIISNNSTVTVEASLDAVSVAEVLAAASGAISVTGSVAAALLRTSQKAAIDGTTITASNSVSVTADEKTYSYAKIEGMEVTISGIDITANFAYALIESGQEAYISGACITAGKIVETHSWHNRNNDDETGAKAETGANGGARVNLVGVLTNIAMAFDNAAVKSYIRGSDISTETLGVYAGGETEYTAAGISQSENNLKAKAGALAGSSISLANVGVMIITARVAGTFDSYIDQTDGHTIDVTYLYVLNMFSSFADALTQAAGSVDASVITSQTNTASAESKTQAESYLTGKGNIKAVIAEVKSVNDGNTVYSHSITSKLTVSVAAIALNVTESNCASVIKAYVNNEGTGFSFTKLTVLGKFNPRGSLNAYNGVVSEVSSAAGAENNSITISAVIGSLNQASAESKAKVTAYVNGNVKVSGALEVDANSLGHANASAKASAGLSLISVGGLFAKSDTHDETKAYLGGNITAGSVNVNASSKSDSSAYAENPGSLSLVGAGISKVEAGVGISADKSQKVSAYIADNANILVTDGDLTIYAYNEGYSVSGFARDTSVALIKLEGSDNHTISYYETEAYVGENDVINVTNGKFSLKAEDNLKATSASDSSMIGSLDSADTMKARGEIQSDIKTSVLKNAEIRARGN